METKKGALTHEEVSRRGGIARARKLNDDERRRIASIAGRVSAENKKKKNTKKEAKPKK